MFYDEGDCCQVLAFTDGKDIKVMVGAQDHKRALDGDKGANTGGMGAYAPCPILSHLQLDFVNQEIIQRAIDGLNKEHIKYVGKCLLDCYSARVNITKKLKDISLNT